MLWKCCTEYASKFGKLSSGHKTGKVQFSFQSLGKAMPKNVQTTTQLHSSHTLAKYGSKFSNLGFNHTWIELPDVQAGFRKGRGIRDQIANVFWIIEKAAEFQKNIYFCFINYAKVFDCVDHNKLFSVSTNCGKFFKGWEYQTTLPDSWELCVQAKKQQWEQCRLVPNWERSTSRLYIVTLLI